MPLATRVLAVLILVSTSARADEFSDFRIPDHFTHSAVASLSGRTAGSDDGGGPSERSSRSRNGSLGIGGFWLHDSERGLTSFNGSVRAIGDRTGSHTQDVSMPPGAYHEVRLAQDLEDVGGIATLSIVARRYPWSVPVSLEAAIDGITVQDERWERSQRAFVDQDSNSSVVHQTSSERDIQNQYFAQGTLTLGYGRVRDASGIYSARLLERRLTNQGVLAHPLSPAAVQKIAALYYMTSDFRLVHDRGDKYFWQELERLLREDGALPEGLDAYAVIHGLEPPSPLGPFFRQSGWSVGVSLSARHDHDVRRSTASFGEVDFFNGVPVGPIEFHDSIRADDEMNTVWLGPTGRFHRAIGVRTQVDALADVSLPLKAEFVSRGVQENSSLAVTWIVADRWYALGRAEHTRISETLKSHAGTVDQWLTVLGATLGYAVEDRVTIELDATDSQSRGLTFEPYDRQGEIRLAVGYRLTSGLSAPGLLQHQRPTMAGFGP